MIHYKIEAILFINAQNSMINTNNKSMNTNN